MACTCEIGKYCEVDNLHYPTIRCEECEEKHIELMCQIAEDYDNIMRLQEWSGNTVLPLKEGKPKHNQYINDDLPF